MPADTGAFINFRAQVLTLSAVQPTLNSRRNKQR
jgi:hypothetical protein